MLTLVEEVFSNMVNLNELCLTESYYPMPGSYNLENLYLSGNYTNMLNSENFFVSAATKLLLNKEYYSELNLDCLVDLFDVVDFDRVNLMKLFDFALYIWRTDYDFLLIGGADSQHTLYLITVIDSILFYETKFKNELLNLSSWLLTKMSSRYIDKYKVSYDLVTLAKHSLSSAILRFNFSLGYKFSTYAKWWVRFGLLNVISKLNFPALQAIRDQRNLHSDENDFDVLSDVKLVTTTSVPLDVKFVTTVNSPSSVKLVTTTTNALDMAISMLSARDERIFRLRNGINLARCYTLKEIGQNVGLTKERVRQLLIKIYNQIKIILGSDSLVHDLKRSFIMV